MLVGSCDPISVRTLAKVNLEDFLVKNWAQTELGRDYDIYSEEGEPVGQQYPTDTGPMDLLKTFGGVTRVTHKLRRA